MDPHAVQLAPAVVEVSAAVSLGEAFAWPHDTTGDVPMHPRHVPLDAPRPRRSSAALMRARLASLAALVRTQNGLGLPIYAGSAAKVTIEFLLYRGTQTNGRCSCSWQR